MGGYSGDRYCGSGSTGTGSNPTPSARYRFATYFPSVVPTGPVSIRLDGF
jgi:hypothetical protein